MRMGNLSFCLFVSSLIVFLCQPSQAETIYESATFCSTSAGGYTFDGGQILGARFHLSQPVQVTAIGGNMAASTQTGGTFFGAIITLPYSIAFPEGNPFDQSEVVASATFNMNGATPFLLEIMLLYLVLDFWGLREAALICPHYFMTRFLLSISTLAQRRMI